MYSRVLLVMGFALLQAASNQDICCVRDDEDIKVSSDYVRRKCDRGKTCINYRFSKTFCTVITQRLIRTNKTIRNLLLDSTCGYVNNEPLVCTNDPADVNPSCTTKQRTRRSDCGKQSTAPDPTRIAGGEDVIPGTWPWMAMLRYRNNKTGVEVSACGGVLISDRWVLTAAHCFELRGFDMFEVRLGENDVTTEFDCMDPAEFCVCEEVCSFSSGEQCLADGQCAPPAQAFDIIQKVSHPFYRKTGRGGRINDIALIELRLPVPETGLVSPVCLPDVVESPFPETGWFVMGWGNTETSVGSGKAADIMQQVEVEVVNKEDCGEAWKRELEENLICATTGERGKGVCQGDSGGPLLRKKNDKWEVHGVVSGGENFCGGPRPTFYSQVTLDQVRWIESYIGTSENSQKG